MRRPLRSTVILALTALATALAAFGGWRYARASAPVNGPIVLVSIDALRPDHLPIYGYHDVATPAIDALAADGVVFDHAYAHATQTLPAHVAILSGRLPFENGVRDDRDVVKSGRLLPELLSDRAYTTGGVVSSSVLGAESGLARSFEFFDADFTPDGGVRRQTDLPPLRRDGARSEEIAERWLDGAGTSRLFLFLHLDEPNRPYDPPDRFSSLPAYDAEIAYADEILGRLVKYLKAHQLYDRSTIVLLSDHGEGLGDHGEQGHGVFVYDEAIHVPLVVKQPAGPGSGRRVPDLVQQIDIAPTILDLVRAPLPGNLRGRSLRPLLDGSGRLTEQPVYSEAIYGARRFGWSGLAALTSLSHQYIRAPREELYDLRADPGERSNVADDLVTERRALRSALDRLRPPVKPQGGSDEPLPDPKDNVELVETYRSAGELAATGKWGAAIRLLQSVVRQDDRLEEVWRRIGAYAMHVGRFEQAADAYARAADLQPNDTAAQLGAAAAFLRTRKLDEARERASLAAEAVAKDDARGRAVAHELLARIALAEHDAVAARHEAALARQADQARPVTAFVEGRLLYEEGSYDEALAQFEAAISALKRSRGAPILDLEYFTAENLVRLGHGGEAEAHFKEELRAFADNTRAAAAFAMFYHANGQPEAASGVIAGMLQASPTPDSYALGARLMTAFGDARQAAAIRAEARRTFAEAR